MKTDRKDKYQKEYFRLTITYNDGEVSGRVFKDRESAEKYAKKQAKAPVVRKTRVEAFIKDRHDWYARRAELRDKEN